MITVLCHPLAARQVAFPGASGPLGLLRRIDMQHDARDFGPVGAFRVRVEKAKISDQVLPVIVGESIRLGSLVGNRRIEWRLLHVRPVL